ncbi:cyclopropane mycolic acid synthase family methyltransferase [Antrihabitans cavernicola]|uniref:Methyltransferase domain-containing protein n=1 Tax=Antrihabitans cavernicola TaxID=2495913 RepID=A0A5A7SFE1_9NOCA|nr:cyclopropane mycolic acid synthase family methyltransferase [Spelaeibacter cavernicola]KAA0024159.1 methyltransferase domain-containing protein [Spelaeibacter cavernicola]
MSDLKPFYSDVQSHYDLSDDFFALFLDPSMTYSCAYFQREDMTLEEAQLAKIDLALGKLNLAPGMTLLDVGCGWGSTIKRALQKYDVNVIGLTLSRNQYDRVNPELAALPNPTGRTAEVRLQGWEEFDGPVDRIVSIGAFEHFRKERHTAFLEKTYRLLPPAGRMLLHTIVLYNDQDLAAMGISPSFERLLFGLFVSQEIFPGGQLPDPRKIRDLGPAAGYVLEREQALQLHYARTLDLWADALQSRQSRALAVGGRTVYERYLKYLTGCADSFREGAIDVIQFTLVKE